MLAKGQITLEQRVLHFIHDKHLVSKRQKLLVAVSGGPDSVCLLHILAKLRKELGVSLHVAHLNHQLRGADADADAQYVAELAQQLDIPATIERRDVNAYQARQRLSPEEAAREVRYTFLTQVAEDTGADRATIGHTVNDHIETILLHLIRGTGTKGLQGLQPCGRWPTAKSSLTIIRPLLKISRQETADYCQHHQLMPRLDASNLSLSPLRNRIRHQLLPLLQSYNPQVTEALLRTARIAADDLAFLNGEATRLWDEIVQEYENTIVLDKARFLELSPALKRHLLRTSIEKLLGNLKDIEARHIKEIMDALTKPAGKKISLPGGLIFSVEYNKFLLGSDPAALSPFPILSTESPLKIPGETQLPGWHVTASIINQVQAMVKDNDLTAYFDFDKVGNKITIRRLQPGDRFQPLGMSQPKKLNEFMIDAKIPGAWRQRIPIVSSTEQILWVVGWRIDERAKVTDVTREILCLKFERRQTSA